VKVKVHWKRLGCFILALIAACVVITGIEAAVGGFGFTEDQQFYMDAGTGLIIGLFWPWRIFGKDPDGNV